jgi:hypothetical protein
LGFYLPSQIAVESGVPLTHTRHVIPWRPKLSKE